MSKQSDCNYTSKSYPFSREWQSSFIRDKKSLPLGQDRATCRGHDLSGSKGLHRDEPDQGEELSGPGSSPFIPDGNQGDKPLGYGDGISTRIFLLESVIHDLCEKGHSEGLRRALKEYALTWIEFEGGILCKK